VNILVTGRGSSGSWQIRGAQLGKAIGAHVEANVNSVKGFDVAVIVKRPRLDLLERLRQRGIPIIWDIVDAWPQPHGNLWSRGECVDWLQKEVNTIKPQALVAATQAMADDCKSFGLPVLPLPHHARPGQPLNPIRPSVLKVGYEGGLQYIGGWTPVLEKECGKRGWGLSLNPQELASVDIVLAVRDQKGYAARHWKSGVKLANAQGSGTPCVLGRERGYMEGASGAEQWADSPEELIAAFDALQAQECRKEISSRLEAAAPSLSGVATRYKRWIETLSF